jgi:hypothetical protein
MLNDLWKISSFQVLPLQLLWFNGVMKSDVITLQWRSSQEQNFSHFNVQRSFDAIHFADIGKRTGANNGNFADYAYLDDAHNIDQPKIFYRLQMVNADGNFTYSKTIRFDRDRAAISLQLYPNPATQYINVSYHQKKDGVSTVLITDMKGVTVKTFTQKITAGNISLDIDLNTLPPGSYILSVIHDNEKSQEKFIKQ